MEGIPKFSQNCFRRGPFKLPNGKELTPGISFGNQSNGKIKPQELPKVFKGNP